MLSQSLTLRDKVMGQKVIVFGGAGFIGTHLLRRLAADARYSDLYCLDVAEPKNPVAGVRYVKCDVRNAIPPDLCGQGEADIFNLAAVHTTPGHEDWEYFWTNVSGAVNVCDFATSIGANRITFTSSISVYGPAEEPKDEDCELVPESAYGRSKSLAENVHKLWQSERGHERIVTIVRPAVIYGAGEHGNFTRLARLMQRGLFVYPGRTDTVKACGYVEDLVSSMFYVQSRNTGLNIYNFCYPQAYTTEQICASFSEVAHFKKPSIVIPTFAIMAAAVFFELLNAVGIKTSINRARVSKLLHSTNIVPRQLMQSGFQYAFDLKSSLAHWKASSPAHSFE
jgi:nucleoside-diphosphate-sugar epimerase